MKHSPVSEQHVTKSLREKTFLRLFLLEKFFDDLFTVYPLFSQTIPHIPHLYALYILVLRLPSPKMIKHFLPPKTKNFPLKSQISP